MALKKRVVVVGTGSIGKRHARLLVNRKDIVVELCEPNPQILGKALEETGLLSTHHSFDQMLESKPDMVLIASPTSLHAEQTLRALEVGAHVLCEKPMSDRLETAHQVYEFAKETRQVLVYGYNNHFHPGILKIKELIDTGKLGTVQYAHYHVGTYITLVNSQSHYQAITKGALLMDYVHQPDLLYWMLGKNPTGIYASGSFGGNLELKSDPNSITLLLDYNNSLTASIHLDYLQHPERAHCEFIGDLGWVFYDFSTNILNFGDRNKQTVLQAKIDYKRDAMYEAEHQAFLDTVEGKRTPESSAEDALQSMIFFDSAIHSWKTKERILLENNFM